MTAVNPPSESFWSLPVDDLLRNLNSSGTGLTTEEARRRLIRFRSHPLRRRRSAGLPLLLSQFKSPLVLLLLAAAGLSAVLHNPTDAGMILVIVLISGLLGFWQERGAAGAVEALLKSVLIHATALRDGSPREVPIDEIVPGDVILLRAGDTLPGDCLLLKAKDLFVDEAALTGETYPVEKQVGILPPDTPLASRTNALFMGTHVISGTAEAMVARTGRRTVFGHVSERLWRRRPETEFERGIRRFGSLLLEVTLVLALAIFAINVHLQRPALDSLLFALALAVGLTPQLLPAIISINLAHGAKRMARRKVIVKRPVSIENFGSMNVLCSDKTGTLTEGMVRVRSALDVDEKESGKVLLYAYLNASFETGFVNPIDEAIRKHRAFDISGFHKLDEEPYDFVRKRLSILVVHHDQRLMVTKGALPSVMEVCSSAELSSGALVEIGAVRTRIMRRADELSGQGFRVIGVAYREIEAASKITKDHETGMVFLGVLVLYDPPKPGVAETLSELARLGVSLKIITGDNRLVATHVSEQVELRSPRVLTGSELRLMSDEALVQQANAVQVFAEVEPNQKERIILALEKAGNVVGYGGDGINDASALHAADVGIFVSGAVDVAKEAADIVLLEKDLRVLADGVREGRVTFANTLKYVFTATSANFGNMFSMAGASLFLPFLPLLPKQILLTNILTDIPEMAIATDRVDPELIDRPRRWDRAMIRIFMLTFGLLSSVFDYLTFGVLLFFLNASMGQFRTGWFLESVVSAAMIVLVIRSRRPFFQSRPGTALLSATLLIVGVTSAVPFTPVGGAFELSPVSLPFVLVVGVIVALYMISAEVVKKIFYRKVAG